MKIDWKTREIVVTYPAEAASQSKGVMDPLDGSHRINNPGTNSNQNMNQGTAAPQGQPQPHPPSQSHYTTVYIQTTLSIHPLTVKVCRDMAMDMLLTILMSVQVRILLHHHLPIMAMHLITHTTITVTDIILRTIIVECHSVPFPSPSPSLGLKSPPIGWIFLGIRTRRILTI